MAKVYYVNMFFSAPVRVNEFGPQSAFWAKVSWLHVQRSALPSVLHLEVLWDIIVNVNVNVNEKFI